MRARFNQRFPGIQVSVRILMEIGGGEAIREARLVRAFLDIVGELQRERRPSRARQKEALPR